MSDILSQLAQLAGPIMKSPQGQQMAQAIMAQMQGGGGGGKMGAMAQQMPPVRDDSVPPPPMGSDAQSAMGGNNLSTEDELAMAQKMMGQGPGSMNVGQTTDPAEYGPGGQSGPGVGMDSGGGMNQEGPTPEEVQLLMSSPTPRNVANFNKLFGSGAAEQVLQGGGGGGSYEDHVRGAMQDPDAANHAQGKYGRVGRGEPPQGNELDDDD